MSEINVGHKSAVHKFRPRDPTPKNIRQFIGDFHEFSDAIVHRCKSIEGAKALNVCVIKFKKYFVT